VIAESNTTGPIAYEIQYESECDEPQRHSSDTTDVESRIDVRR
jgi:hypothetical protein